jgi:hypothetical protein
MTLLAVMRRHESPRPFTARSAVGCHPLRTEPLRSVDDICFV